MARKGWTRPSVSISCADKLKAIRRELGGRLRAASARDGGAQKDAQRPRPAQEGQKEADKQLSRLSPCTRTAPRPPSCAPIWTWLIDLPWRRPRIDTGIAKEAAVKTTTIWKRSEAHGDAGVRKLNPSMKGPILCFVGPPGVGRASLSKSIARSLGRKFVRMSLGGMQDEAQVPGYNRRTYIGPLARAHHPVHEGRRN